MRFHITRHMPVEGQPYVLQKQRFFYHQSFHLFIPTVPPPELLSRVRVQRSAIESERVTAVGLTLQLWGGMVSHG